MREIKKFLHRIDTVEFSCILMRRGLDTDRRFELVHAMVERKTGVKIGVSKLINQTRIPSARLLSTREQLWISFHRKRRNRNVYAAHRGKYRVTYLRARTVGRERKRGRKGAREREKERAMSTELAVSLAWDCRVRVASALLRGKTSFHIWKRINYRYVCFVISFTSWNGIGGTRSDGSRI